MEKVIHSHSRKVTEIIFFGNIWISLGAVSLSLYSYLLFDWKINIPFLALVFLSTLASYNFQRVVRIKHKNLSFSNRHFWIVNSKKILSLVILFSSVVSAGLFLWLFEIIDLFYVFPILLIGFFYAFSPKKKTKPLRDLPYIKIILIVISWIAVTIILPAHLENEIDTQLFKLSIIQFLYIIGLTIPFDIRDLEYDEKEKKTIPQVIGIKKSIILSIVLIAISGILHLIWFKNFWLVGIIYIFSILTISFSNNRRTELFYVFWIDGLLLLFPLFAIAQKLILHI